MPSIPKGTGFTWGHGQIHFQDHTGVWWLATGPGLSRYPKVRHTEASRIPRLKGCLRRAMDFQAMTSSRCTKIREATSGSSSWTECGDSMVAGGRIYSEFPASRGGTAVGHAHGLRRGPCRQCVDEPVLAGPGGDIAADVARRLRRRCASQRMAAEMISVGPSRNNASGSAGARSRAAFGRQLGPHTLPPARTRS